MRVAAPTETDRTGGDVLDNPVFAALTGPHAGVAEAVRSARRYPDDMAPFLALPHEPAPRDWRAAAELIGSGPAGWLFRTTLAVPDGWELAGWMDAVQMVAVGAEPADDPDVVELTWADVPEMVELVRRTEPGPLRDRTLELGRYLGIRRDGELVAMAGERMRVPGWTEVSAVCTDAAHRGAGLASRLVRAVLAGIARRGDRAFLHADAANTTAVRLYEGLGFTVRTGMIVAGVRPVAARGAPSPAGQSPR